jgi:hypothetical protein
VIEGKIEGTGESGRRSNHLLDNFKKMRREWKLKEEAADYILCKTHFGTRYEPGRLCDDDDDIIRHT